LFFAAVTLCVRWGAVVEGKKRKGWRQPSQQRVRDCFATVLAPSAKRPRPPGCIISLLLPFVFFLPFYLFITIVYLIPYFLSPS
jgi:hypothetical protein